ncbi:MAG: putative Ig domain-containing protein [Thermoproteota archaeon]
MFTGIKWRAFFKEARCFNSFSSNRQHACKSMNPVHKIRWASLPLLTLLLLVFANLPVSADTPLTITTESLPDGQVWSSYFAVLTASGGVPPYLWSIQTGSLPPGLSLSNDGYITGTPTAEGTYTFTVKVLDQRFDSAYALKTLSIKIVRIAVEQFDFKLNVLGDNQVTVDINSLYTGAAYVQLSAFTIRVEHVSGPSRPVSLSMVFLPNESLPGVQGFFTQSSGSPPFTTNLTLRLTPDAVNILEPKATVGGGTIIIRGVGDGLVREVRVKLFVKVTGDLHLFGADPIQAVYGVPMVQGKSTVFRIRIHSSFPKTMPALVFLGLVDNWSVYPSLMRNILAYNWLFNITPGINYYWIVPPTGIMIYPLAPEANYEVKLDPWDAIGEYNESNNVLQGSVSVFTTKGLKLFYSPVVFEWEAAYYYGIGEIYKSYFSDVNDLAEEATDFIRGTYPIADSKVSYMVGPAYYYYTSEAKTYEEWSKLHPLTRLYIIKDVFLKMQNLAWSVGCDRFVAVVPNGWIGTYISARAIGVALGGVSGAVMVQRGVEPNVVAHEIAHTLAYSDDIYSGSFCHIRGSDGYWVEKRKPMSERYTWFFMDYAGCGIYWINQDGYTRLLLSLKSTRDPEVVGVRGVVFQNGTASFKPFLRLENQTVDLEPGTVGNYYFILLDQAGRELLRTGFNCTFTLLIDPGGTIQVPLSQFAFRIPWVNGTKQIQLRDSAGVVLASRDVSPNPPVVRVIFPNGGEELTKSPLTSYAVTWDSSDPDGDQLSYTVLYSPDDGETWIPLETDMPVKTGIINTGVLQPGNRYLIKVIATDGVNTASDTSDLAFTVSDSAEFYTVQVKTSGLANLTARVSVDGSEVGRVSDYKPLLLRFGTGSTHSITLEQYIQIGEDKRFVTENMTFQVQSPGMYEAVYVAEYLLTVKSACGNPSGGGWYKDGDIATFSIQQQVPMEGMLGILGGVYRFKHWTGDSNATTLTASIVMNGPKTVIAVMQEDVTQVIIILVVAVLVIVVLALLLIRRRAKPLPPPPPPPV